MSGNYCNSRENSSRSKVDGGKIGWIGEGRAGEARGARCASLST
ncbi:MAG: hypothetical protein ACTSU9_17400 [Promethearchaeota archaeon]